MEYTARRKQHYYSVNPVVIYNKLLLTGLLMQWAGKQEVIAVLLQSLPAFWSRDLSPFITRITQHLVGWSWSLLSLFRQQLTRISYTRSMKGMEQTNPGTTESKLETVHVTSIDSLIIIITLPLQSALKIDSPRTGLAKHKVTIAMDTAKLPPWMPTVCEPTVLNCALVPEITTTFCLGCCLHLRACAMLRHIFNRI